MGEHASPIAAHPAGHRTESCPAERQGIVDGEGGGQALRDLALPDYTAQRRDELLWLYTQLEQRVQQLDKQVEKEAQGRPQARRWLTHPGVGPVTALATEVFLGDPHRLDTAHQVA